MCAGPGGSGGDVADELFGMSCQRVFRQGPILSRKTFQWLVLGQTLNLRAGGYRYKNGLVRGPSEDIIEVCMDAAIGTRFAVRFVWQWSGF